MENGARHMRTRQFLPHRAWFENDRAAKLGSWVREARRALQRAQRLRIGDVMRDSDSDWLLRWPLDKGRKLDDSLLTVMTGK